MCNNQERIWPLHLDLHMSPIYLLPNLETQTRPFCLTPMLCLTRGESPQIRLFCTEQLQIHQLLDLDCLR